MPDLSTWNLTIPQGRPAITISTSQLQRDYRSDYFQRTADGIRFWVPVNGSHTRNSEFPRSELRETLSSGRPYNWRYARADNWLEATLRIEAVPSTRRMIIGQIHSDGSNSGQAARSTSCGSTRGGSRRWSASGRTMAGPGPTR